MLSSLGGSIYKPDANYSAEKLSLIEFPVLLISGSSLFYRRISSWFSAIWIERVSRWCRWWGSRSPGLCPVSRRPWSCSRTKSTLSTTAKSSSCGRQNGCTKKRLWLHPCCEYTAASFISMLTYRCVPACIELVTYKNVNTRGIL